MRVNLTTNGEYWQASWTDAHGKRYRKSLGSRAKVSKTAARRMVDELVRNHALNPTARAVSGRSVTLADWWQWWETNEAPSRNDKTLDGYRATKARTLEVFGLSIPIDRITRAAVSAWRASMQKDGLALNTVRGNLMRFAVVLGAAVKVGALATNPLEHEPRSMVKTDVPWRYVTTDEAEKLLAVTARPEWQTAIALARYAGLRINEIRALTWADVDRVGRMLTVRHEGAQTTKKRERQVPIVPRLLEVLEAALEQFPPGEQSVAPIGSNNTYRAMEPLRARAGIPEYGKPFHTLRKSCESDWLARWPATDVCKWLGHDPTVAGKRYHASGRRCWRRSRVSVAQKWHKHEGWQGVVSWQVAK